MSAPLVVNTTDGTVWTRREGSRGGEALYAPEKCGKCPQFVMATLTELAVHGIVGAADVLPVPVGPEPQALPLKVVAELNDLRMRLAGMANPPRELFLALYEGAEPELFTTVEAARECCDDLAKSDAGENYWDWTVNEYGIHVQFWTHPDDDRPLSETSGSVTPVVVQGDEPVSELETLRARVAELEHTVQKMCNALNGHDCPPPDETPMQTVTRVAVRLMEAERQVAELEAEPLAWAEELDAKSLDNFLISLGTATEHEPMDGAIDQVHLIIRSFREAAQADDEREPDVDGVGRTYESYYPERSVKAADRLSRLLAPTQVLREDVYESPLHRDYAVGHDLPETDGGRSC